MDGILTPANIIRHSSAKSTYFASELQLYLVVIWKRANVPQHGVLSSADGNGWNLGEHDKLDMFEPVWFVQYVKIDSNNIDLDN